MKIFQLLLVAFVILGCSKKESAVNSYNKADSAIIKQHAKPMLTKEDSIKTINDKVLKSIKQNDFEEFSGYIHPEKGIRFSMYAFVDTLKDKHFTKNDFLRYAKTLVKFTWGAKDGTGEPLVLSIKNYFSDWVFKKDFSTSSYSINEFQAEGNSLNNLKEIYPKADFTENYLKGSEKYNGMDWGCLRLVFEKQNGQYYLTAVINDEWTI